MKQTISYTDFKEAFRKMDRLNHFPTGLRELYYHLLILEDEQGEELELDVIGLCCDFTEDKLSEVLKQNNLSSLKELENHTTVFMVEDESSEDPTIIYQAF